MTFSCTYEELKRLAAEFLKAIPNLDEDGLDNGLKCFDLHYLHVTFEAPADPILAASLLKYVHKQYWARVMDIAFEDTF